MRQIWPAPPGPELTDDELYAAYAVSEPTVRGNFVASADGNVAPAGGSNALADSADRRVLRVIRDVADAVIVGAQTLRSENYLPLVGTAARRERRQAAGRQPYPTLVVVSASGTGLATQRAVAQAPTRPIVLTHRRSPAARDSALANVADIVITGDTELDLPAAVAELRTRGFQHLLCEGGPTVFGALLNANLVGELCLTLAPQLTADPRLTMHADQLTAGHALQLQKVLVADGTLLLRYHVEHSRQS